MLDVGGAGKGQRKLPVLLSEVVDRVDFQRLSPAPAVPLIARDAFVSDVAIKLDQLRIELGSLSRDLKSTRQEVMELREECGRHQRFSAFQDTQQRANSGKLDDVSRRLKDIKMRCDRIDGRSDGNFHGYSSFEAVSKKLTELGELQRKFRAVDRQLKISAGLFCGSVVLWLFAVMA